MIKDNSHLNKRKQEQVFYAIDIGSYIIRLTSGTVDLNKHVKIIGMKQCRSKGITKGFISDINSLANQIALIVQDFQNTYGVIIEKVVIGVSGYYIVSENEFGASVIQNETIDIFDRNRTIRNAIAGVRNISETEYTLIHAIPQIYNTETFKYITNPIGLFAKRLEVNLHVIGCKYMFKKNIELAIKKANPSIEVNSIIYEGNAAASAVLSEDEKEIGVILIDIGGETVNVTVYEDKLQVLSFGISVGGNYITQIIAKAFSITIEEAEYLKCQYGFANPQTLATKYRETFITLSESDSRNSQDNSTRTISLENLSNTINHGVLSIFELLFQKINRLCGNNIKSLEIGGGIVLTGGGSKLVGIKPLVSNYISDISSSENSFVKCSSKVRIGHPINISVYDSAGSPSFVSDSDKAVAIGLLRAGKFESLMQYISDDSRRSNSSVGSIISRFLSWWKSEF